MNTLTGQLNSNRQLAALQRDTFDRAVTGIRSNRNLSDEGKRSMIGAEFVRVREALVKLHEAETKMIADRLAELESRVYGPESPFTSTLERRDAEDRASKIQSPSEALEVYQRAKLASDKTLVRALVHQSLRHAGDGWAPIADDYYEARPTEAAALQELRQLQQYQGSMDAVLAASHYSVLKPSDIGYAA